MFRSIVIAITAVWLGALASGATVGAVEPSPLRVDIASLDDSQFPRLSAVVNVLDASGGPIVGLDKTSFQATVGGEPATVQSLQTAIDSQVSLGVVLAVDVSGSMNGEPLTAAKAAATGFVSGLSPQDSVAVITFGDAINVVQDFSSDKAMVTNAIGGLQAAGNTALFEATSQAVAKSLESTSPRRAIILLSDGVDYGGKSSVTRDDSIAQARAANVPIYTIGLGADVDKAYLGELAQATGARLLEAPTPQSLSQLYADIANVLRGQYIITLESPTLDRGAPLTFELSVSAGGTTAVAANVLPATGVPAAVTLPDSQPNQEASTSGGGLAKTPLLVALLAVAAAAGGIYVWRRRRRPRYKSRKVVECRLQPWSNGAATAAGGSSLFGEEEEEPEPVPETVDEPAGRLLTVGGPASGSEFLVGASPVSIGSACWCGITLPDEDGSIGPEEARAWVHGDRLIFHKLTRLSVLAADGEAGGWLIFEHGDEIVIGHHRLRFEALTPVMLEDASVNQAVNEAVQQLAVHPYGLDPAVEEEAPDLRPIMPPEPSQPANEEEEDADPWSAAS